jgi:lysozyme family protein
MKINFEQCIEWLLAHEGGYVDHPEDPGGETNLGVTQRVYRRWCMEQDYHPKDMRDLTPDDVTPIYRANYWQAIAGDELSSGLDWCCFDFAVNAGAARSARSIQTIVKVKADGAIGKITLAAIESHDAASLIDAMHDRRQRFYEKLKGFEHFGKGWTRRNQETKEQAHALLNQ